jgi:hypothetical protein
VANQSMLPPKSLVDQAICAATSGQPPAPAHLSEIAEILAAGLTRLRARKSSGILLGETENSLDTFAQQSGAVPQTEGNSR